MTSRALSSLGAESVARYPIDDVVVTTAERTVVPDPVHPDAETFFPYEVEKYRPNGYGQWHFGPGLRHERRLDLLGIGALPPPPGRAERLLRFFTITDIHITDKESPAQAIVIGFKGGSPLAIGAYSMIMLYTTQVLDAAVQTIDALHRVDAFDFGLSLGDAANNTQYNELRWFVDVIDGKVINPASGVATDSSIVPVTDYEKPFQATGLDSSIPWYEVIGNHDQSLDGSDAGR